MSNAATRVYASALQEQERNELVVNNLAFVRHVLGRLVGRLPANVDEENLQQAGVLGLVEASHQFDPDRGVSFQTFAYPRVWGAIVDELRRNSPLPQKVMNRITKVKRVQESMEPPITVERLADACDMPVDDVEACLVAMRLSSPASLGDQIIDAVGSRSNDSVSAELELAETRELLADCIEQLPEKQRLVVTLYYSEDLRLKEIGQVLSLSESRISRILAAAQQRLRDAVCR